MPPISYCCLLLTVCDVFYRAHNWNKHKRVAYKHPESVIRVFVCFACFNCLVCSSSMLAVSCLPREQVQAVAIHGQTLHTPASTRLEATTFPRLDPFCVSCCSLSLNCSGMFECSPNISTSFCTGLSPPAAPLASHPPPPPPPLPGWGDGECGGETSSRHQLQCC